MTNPNESYLIYDNIVVTPGFGYTSAGPISLDYTGYGTYFFSQLFYAKSGHEIEWYYDSNGGNIATSNMTFITKVAVEKLVGVTT